MVISVLFPRNYYSSQFNLQLISKQINIVLFVFTISKYFCLLLFSHTEVFCPLSRSTQRVDPGFITTESVETFRKRLKDQELIPLASPRSVMFNVIGIISNFYPLHLQDGKIWKLQGKAPRTEGTLSAGYQGELATHTSLMYINNKAIYSRICYIAQSGMYLFCKYPKLW